MWRYYTQFFLSRWQFVFMSSCSIDCIFTIIKQVAKCSWFIFCFVYLIVCSRREMRKIQTSSRFNDSSLPGIWSQGKILKYIFSYLISWIFTSFQVLTRLFDITTNFILLRRPNLDVISILMIVTNLAVYLHIAGRYFSWFLSRKFKRVLVPNTMIFCILWIEYKSTRLLDQSTNRCR